MTLVPVPAELTEKIAYRAVQLAREFSIKRGWRSYPGLVPSWGEGYAGIRSIYKHLVYQNTGTRPRLMTELEGKTIPMSDGRFVRVKGVGTPGVVTLPGGVQVFRQKRWLHPGVPATNFMQTSLEKAVEEYEDEIAAMLEKLLGGA